ncbi:unnamed protein product [Allacma fusca]|uniref:Uncharacterized protein n=1 Tax=Allacma fusca TaxID=39272 RepID=A0A8J2JHW9_9HEXA|nr:unnamed protein product [Allacma fusca]
MAAVQYQLTCVVRIEGPTDVTWRSELRTLIVSIQFLGVAVSSREICQCLLQVRKPSKMSQGHVLYRSGPLSVAWQLGSRVLGLKKGRQKLRAAILRANLNEISDLIMESMVIPRPLHAGDGLNRMNPRTTSILVLGANRIFGMQLDSALRRLDEILLKLTVPMLPSNEIDLPPEPSRGQMTTVLLSTADFPADFGRCELDPMMEPLSGTAQGSQATMGLSRKSGSGFENILGGIIIRGVTKVGLPEPNFQILSISKAQEHL